MFVYQFDRDRFEDLYADMKWLEGKTGRAVSQGKMKKEKKGLKFSQLVSQVDDDIMFPVRNPFMALADLPDTGDNTAKDDSRKELETKNSDELEALFGGLGFKDGEGGEELFELELKQNKRAYYIDKFEEPTADELVLFYFIFMILREKCLLLERSCLTDLLNLLTSKLVLREKRDFEKSFCLMCEALTLSLLEIFLVIDSTFSRKWMSNIEYNEYIG